MSHYRPHKCILNYEEKTNLSRYLVESLIRMDENNMPPYDYDFHMMRTGGEEKSGDGGERKLNKLLWRVLEYRRALFLSSPTSAYFRVVSSSYM